MKIQRKYLAIATVSVAVVVLFVVAILISPMENSSKWANPEPTQAPTTTQTTEQPTTAAPTLVVPPAPSETIKTLKPLEPQGCVQDGVSTRGWTTNMDDQSEPPDSRAGIMALGNVDGVYFQSGDCFDTMVVKTDTSEPVGFHAEYVDKSQMRGIASDLPVAVAGNYFIRLVVTAHVGVGDSGSFGFIFAPHGNSFPAIQDVQFLGYQEGRMAFGVGVSDYLPFVVTRQANPDGAPGSVAIALHIAH